MSLKKTDPFFPIKRMGYYMAQMPDDGIQSSDFLRFAKFQLCIKMKRLMKDPIWNDYTKEELLAEYFAHQFDTDKMLRTEMERALGLNEAAIEDFGDWADRQMAKDKAEQEDQLKLLEDHVSFNPQTDVLGE